MISDEKLAEIEAQANAIGPHSIAWKAGDRVSSDILALVAEIRRLRETTVALVGDAVLRLGHAENKVQRLRDAMELVMAELRPDRYLTPGERDNLRLIVDVVLRETAP